MLCVKELHVRSKGVLAGGSVQTMRNPSMAVSLQSTPLRTQSFCMSLE